MVNSWSIYGNYMFKPREAQLLVSIRCDIVLTIPFCKSAQTFAKRGAWLQDLHFF